jgi:hypothetical protein
MAQNPALEANPLVGVLTSPESTPVSFVGPVAFSAAITVELAANGTGGASDLLGDVTQ